MGKTLPDSEDGLLKKITGRETLRTLPAMNFSRRSFVRLGVGAVLSLPASRLLAQQGMGGHTAKPVPRGAPSGRPFNAHFVDVAADAGLHAPVIYGDEETKKYIVESTGCGCAFIDYDNDGWMML
jgi:hypothetical protein